MPVDEKPPAMPGDIYCCYDTKFLNEPVGLE